MNPAQLGMELGLEVRMRLGRMSGKTVFVCAV